MKKKNSSTKVVAVATIAVVVLAGISAVSVSSLVKSDEARLGSVSGIDSADSASRKAGVRPDAELVNVANEVEPVVSDYADYAAYTPPTDFVVEAPVAQAAVIPVDVEVVVNDNKVDEAKASPQDVPAIVAEQPEVKSETEEPENKEPEVKEAPQLLLAKSDPVVLLAEAEPQVQEAVFEIVEEVIEEDVPELVVGEGFMAAGEVQQEEVVEEVPELVIPEFEAPVVEAPAYEEPVVEAPVYEEPAYVEPVYEEPAYVEPVVEAPVYEEPVVEAPAYEEPVVEAPAYEEPVVEAPVYEEPVVEAPVYEEPASDLGYDAAAGMEYVPEETAAAEAATTEAATTDGTTSSIRQDLVDYAMSRVGVTPYVWAGDSLETGTDCSGFVSLIYDSFGYYASAGSADYQNVEGGWGTNISYDELQVGDVVVYRDGGHVGIYAGQDENGNDIVVHDSNEIDGVKVSDMNYTDPTAFVRIIDD